VLVSKVLSSRTAKLEVELPYTPGQTSTTSVTSKEQTRISFELWVLMEETEEEQSPQKDMVDDGVPVNRSNSFRNLSTLIAWERLEGLASEKSETSLTRQKPQSSIDFTKCGSERDADLKEVCFWNPRFINRDAPNNTRSFAEGTNEDIEPSDDESGDYVMVEGGVKEEKIPFRSRVFWRIKQFRNRKKERNSQLTGHKSR